MDLIELSIGLDRVRMPWYLQQMLEMCQNSIFLNHKSKKSHFLRKKICEYTTSCIGRIM